MKINKTEHNWQEYETRRF